MSVSVLEPCYVKKPSLKPDHSHSGLTLFTMTWIMGILLMSSFVIYGIFEFLLVVSDKFNTVLGKIFKDSIDSIAWQHLDYKQPTMEHYFI